MGLISCTKTLLQSNKHNSNKPTTSHIPNPNHLPPPTTNSPPSTTYHCITTLKGHTSSISSIAVSTARTTTTCYDARPTPNLPTTIRTSIYTCSSNGEIRLWDFDPSQQSQISQLVCSREATIKALVVKGNKLFSAHQDSKICVWKIGETGSKHKLVAVLPTLRDRVISLLFSRRYVRVRRHKWNTWVHHVDAVVDLAQSSDGSTLYSVSWDRSVKVWRTSDYRCIESISPKEGHRDAINAIAMSKDGFLYTGSSDATIKIWRQLRGEQKHSLLESLNHHTSAINALALSPDGQRLYSGGCDQTIIVWKRLETNRSGMSRVDELKGHQRAILCLVALGLDMVCSGSADKTIRVWGRSGGLSEGYGCLVVLEGHNGPVKCLGVVHDGLVGGDGACSSSSGGSLEFIVCSGGFDCDVRLWKVLVR